jgi:aspartyl-tRNA(Asn)/glutamyl-tRNA(Gln) amidotransferase subunit B
MNTEYEIVIGLEVHVQLNTTSKIFCADANSFGDLPNRHTSVISLAHPGTLPRVNKNAIHKGIQLALAIGSKINKENRFDRKHYFYPDSPKAYQITQDRLPICVGGSLDLYEGENKRTIRFHHVHMEEDAGKSVHDIDPANSLIDLNRAGTPLLEIVTEPDLRSPQEVFDFMSTLQHLVKYIGISDANMDEGQMRADCNVSVRRKGETILNNRCEVKNVNSKRFAKEAVTYEAKRQIALMEKGEHVAQQTLHFDPETGKTSSIRDKEDAHDYRYFPDPDLPPVFITDEQIREISEQLPLLPSKKRKIYSEKKINQEHINVITQEIEYVNYFDTLLDEGIPTKAAANHFVNTVLPEVKENFEDKLDQFPLSIAQQAEFINLIEQDKIVRSTAVQQLFPALLNNPSKTPTALCEELNLFQSNDGDLIDTVIQQIITDNPDEVAKYKKGKKGLIGFFVGQAMKLTKGQSNPKVLQKKISQALAE